MKQLMTSLKMTLSLRTSSLLTPKALNLCLACSMLLIVLPVQAQEAPLELPALSKNMEGHFFTTVIDSRTFKLLPGTEKDCEEIRSDETRRLMICELDDAEIRFDDGSPTVKLVRLNKSVWTGFKKDGAPVYFYNYRGEYPLKAPLEGQIYKLFANFSFSSFDAGSPISGLYGTRELNHMRNDAQARFASE